jgi:hypothetical protein
MKPKKNSELQMTITPGAVLKCPHCARESSLSVYDGDTIPMREAMPDAKVVAGGLALSKDGHCFYAHLSGCLCQVCGGRCYTVDLNVVDGSEVSRDWAAHISGSTEKRKNLVATLPSLRAAAVCRGTGLWNGRGPKPTILNITASGRLLHGHQAKVQTASRAARAVRSGKTRRR